MKLACVQCSCALNLLKFGHMSNNYRIFTFQQIPTFAYQTFPETSNPYVTYSTFVLLI